MVPLFGAVPGGPEMLIILLVMVFLFGIPLVLLLGGGALGAKLFADSGGSADEERVDRLAEELAETKAELRELRERQGDGSAGANEVPDSTDQTESEPSDGTESRSS